MKRRNFLGLAGQSLALVAAAPALVPLATAAPARHWRSALPSEHAIQAMTRDLLAKAERHANPPLVFGDGGLRMHQLVTGRTPREFKLSTPYDLSSAECEPDHTIEADV